MVLHNNKFVLKGTEMEVQLPSPRYIPDRDSREHTSLVYEQNILSAAADGRFDLDENLDPDDDGMTETSRTDDDPVGDAFRKVLDGSDRDEEEDQEEEGDDQIVWDPR